MLCLAVTYLIKEGQESQAVEFLKIMTEHTRAEPGNLVYQAHCSPTNPRQFFLYEQYRDDAALEAHRTAPYFQQYVIEGIREICDSRVAETYETL